MRTLTNLNLPGHRKRHLAKTLHGLHTVPSKPSQAKTDSSPIRAVCISDTHNTRPTLPPGDILIHAGNLTEYGSFDEVQAGLNWLSIQPHCYKLFIAGNHHVLFDEAFLTKYPERRYGQTKIASDLDWGTVTCLQDSCLTLKFPAKEGQTSKDTTSSRKLTIFGSPWTPQCGISAFQYPRDDENHWASRFASLSGPKPDIVVIHGPPKHHFDSRDFFQAECPFLAEEISRVSPRLVVFGHIHASYGREEVVLDGAQKGL